MSEQTVLFRVRYARRIPDPVFHTDFATERHVFIVPVKDIPRGLPLDPNARQPNIRRLVYREVEKSLLNEDCEPNTFHLKNNGITIIAATVKKDSENKYFVSLNRGHGIVDGGHTYALINEHFDDPTLPDDQCVKVEILTGIPSDWIPEIAGGLNTSVQVQQKSLMDLEGAFSWIQNEIKDEPYYKHIAWRENEQALFDVRDIISMMVCFNIDFFPNDHDQDRHPVSAYEKKSASLNDFKKDHEKNEGRSFKKVRPILKDILVLYDTIRYEFSDVWNELGGKAGKLKIVEYRDKDKPRVKPFEFPFIGETGYRRLTRGALYPILAAFRWMVQEDLKTGNFQWRGGFDEVMRRWKEIGPRLVDKTVEKGKEVGRNPDAIGKSRTHWTMLHQDIAFVDLMRDRKVV